MIIGRPTRQRRPEHRPTHPQPPLLSRLLAHMCRYGRPVIIVGGGRNPAGIGDAEIVGSLRGVPVVVDDNIIDTAGVGPVILGSNRDAILYEDAETPAQIAVSYPDALTTDLSVYGFSSLAIRRPDAFATINLTTT